MCKGNLFRIFLGLLVYFCKNVAGIEVTSIGVVGHTGPMTEGVGYELRCDVQNVVPDHLTVRWYKGNTLLTSQLFNDTIKTPVTKSATYWIFPTITDDGAEYWCEAEHRLGPARDQPDSSQRSEKLVTTVHCNCPVVIQPPAVVVQHGTSVSVNCSTSSKDHEAMAWEASQGSVDLTPNVQLITWKMPRVEEWDIKPLCYINLAPRGQVKRHLPVVVYKTPDSVSIDLVDHTGPVTEGSQYKLQCDIQNVAPDELLTVKWYKGQTLLTDTFFNHTTKTPVNKSATLQISPSRADDGAVYWCEAELRLGPAGPQPPPTKKSDLLSITVHYGPEISNCPELVWLKEGESLKHYCSVTGNPLPKLSWLWAGQAVDPAHPLNRTDNGRSYSINITADINRYQQVFVMYGPEISCTNRIAVVEGNEVKPGCIVEGYPPPEMMWFKEGESVRFPQRMQRADAGKYVLVASNNSTANHTLEIEVLYPPSDIVELQNQSVTQGATVGLKCASSARPRPEYRWVYHNESNVRVMNEDGVSMLFIDNASRNNIGTYSCIAYNALGEKQLSVRVNVQGAEALCLLNLNPSSVVLEYRKSVEVECTASALTFELYWEFLNDRVNDRTLFLTTSQFKNWDERPLCTGTFIGLDKCSKPLDITLYKTPDNVSIDLVNHTGPVTEGSQYKLQCDIQNVAPAELLTVKWYKGQTLLTDTFFNHTIIKTPVNKSATLQISPSRADDGALYWCEAELRLGPAGPQPPPTMSSQSIIISVHSKPVINKAKLPSIVPVFWGYPELLVCEAEGHPAPVISWNSDRAEGGNLTITEATNENGGVYNCTATNSAGIDIVSVKVVMKVASCPVVLTPPVVVVEYGTSVSVDCSISIAHRGMGWEASQGQVDVRDGVQLVTWRVFRLEDWNMKPFCYVNISKAGLQCRRGLTVHIYKTPDRVSISTVGHTGPMTEGRQYELQCDIQNVAPVRFLTVTWYKGQTLVAKTSISDSTETPVNESTRYRIVPSRADDGAQFRCEAKLDLNWDSTGAQRTPGLSSHVLNIAVHYIPEVFRLVEIFDQPSEDVMLNCTVTANPTPSYTWYSTNRKGEFNQGLPVLSSSSLSSGNYTCIASNRIGIVRKLFIFKAKHKGGKYSIFWAIVGPFIGFAVVLIVGYVLKMRIG